MLFEAMPLSLRSDKRKSAHCHEDLPLSKKIALDHQAAPKYVRSKLMSFSRSAEKLVLPNLDQIAMEESVVRRNEDSADAKLALDLSSDKEDSDVWITKHARAHQENGLGKTNSSHVSEGEIDSFVQSNMLVDNERSGILDCSTSIHSPAEKKMVSSGRTDFQTGSNGKVISLSAKQPSIVLEDLKKSTERKKTGYDRRLAESASSSLLLGGYMRRMASLNASACVTALMEPEKKYRPDKNTMTIKPYKINGNEGQLKGSRNSWSLSSDDSSAGIPSPIMGLEDLEPSRVNDLSLSPFRFYGSSTSSEADTSKDSDEILSVSEPHRSMYTLLALATLASTATCDLDEIPYNKLGLLYNGDTIHPAARVFFTSDTDLTLPDRIIPRVVPSQEKFVRFAISKAMAQRSVGKKRKGAKANNGWMPLGDPVKSIEYYDGSNCVIRRHYAGIRRNNAKEVIFIRDSVLIRSGGTSMQEEKPYVAKIASIWQEQPGQLMMTVFWYYRPHELDSVAMQGISFQEDELLASQHNDDNSVACIEEKCYVLGTKQYCRYQAYIQSKKEGKITRPRGVVPPCLKSSEPYPTSQLSWSAGFPELSHPGLVPVKPVESSLVYLCHRGYNHCASKLISKSGPR